MQIARQRLVGYSRPGASIDGTEGRCPCHVKRNDARVWDRVLELVDDPALDVRRWVFHLLGDGSPREREAQVVAAFERFTRDLDEKLQRRARQVLAKYRQDGTINVL